jgi:hypothetical protein
LIAAFHPIEPIPVGIVNGECGANLVIHLGGIERREWAE